MDIRRLEVFCKVVELRSFTRAAQAALLTQPTVSENIRQLEEAVGERLLDRLGREVLPTPAGEILYRYARRILQLKDEANQALAQFRGRLGGELVVGASTVPGTYLLPRLVESFRAAHPGVRVVVRIAGTGGVVAGLLDGAWELGLVGARSREPGLEYRELPGDELVVAVAPGHPWSRLQAVAPAALAGEPFIQREAGSGTRQFVEGVLQGAGLAPTGLEVVAEMGSSEAVRQGVKAGLGVAVLSSLVIRDDLERGSLRALSLRGVEMRRPFYLVRRRQRELTPLAAAFAAHLPGGSPA